jgi:hypothetical protein
MKRIISKKSKLYANSKYAAEYRYKNCYKCPAFFNGKNWQCKGTPIEVSSMCNWSGAKWIRKYFGEVKDE